MQQQKLLNNIFNISNTTTEAKSLLEMITKEHPYFGLAQFFYLKNTTPAASDFNEIAAKTNLFFNDPFFLNAQLLDEDIVEEIILKKPVDTFTDFPVPVNENITIDDISTKKEEPHSVDDVTEYSTIPAVANSIVQDDESIKKLFERDTAQPPLIFEPLHSSDYFASLGIKLSDEALVNDKLGNQLKSFTAWLKTMKKVHTNKLPAVSTILDTAVQTQAEKSNVEEDIVTEPMAEAYIQQSKFTKAIEIYSKLSLLYPSKSVYFAAKIDSLKK